MRGVFEDDPLPLTAPRRDAEVTLGVGALLAIFSGLVLLCALCFGLGYEFGRRAMPTTANLPSQSLPTQAGAQKPSAAAPLVGQTADASIEQHPSAESASKVDEPMLSEDSSSDNATQHPATPMTSGSAPPLAHAVPSAGGATPIVIQVASLTDANDAEYLLEALKKRGYPAMARREAGNHAIQVRVGPFTSHEDANRWRQRLMGDGYNATILP